MSMTIKQLVFLLLSALVLSGCVPRIEVAAPKEPITINMNIKIKHDIDIKADKEVKRLLKNKSDVL
ncbi:YnbE family lipoprotein [Enterobacteriaceae bacterium LUAb1]